MQYCLSQAGNWFIQDMTKFTIPDGAGYGWILGEVKGWLKPPAAEKAEGYLQCLLTAVVLSADSGNSASNLPNFVASKVSTEDLPSEGDPALMQPEGNRKDHQGSVRP